LSLPGRHLVNRVAQAPAWVRAWRLADQNSGEGPGGTERCVMDRLGNRLFRALGVARAGVNGALACRRTCPRLRPKAPRCPMGQAWPGRSRSWRACFAHQCPAPQWRPRPR
jgi:hypothetical protein